eukprot:2372431-Prorocentrum_lima.AAC.1
MHNNGSTATPVFGKDSKSRRTLFVPAANLSDPRAANLSDPCADRLVLKPAILGKLILTIQHN